MNRIRSVLVWIGAKPNRKIEALIRRNARNILQLRQRSIVVAVFNFSIFAHNLDLLDIGIERRRIARCAAAAIIGICFYIFITVAVSTTNYYTRTDDRVFHIHKGLLLVSAATLNLINLLARIVMLDLEVDLEVLINIRVIIEANTSINKLLAGIGLTFVARNRA